LRHALALALTIALAACSAREAPQSSLEIAARGAYSAAIAPGGRLVAVGSLTHGGSLWDVQTGERRFNWNHRPGALSQVAALAFAPGGDVAMSAENDTVVLWDTARGTAITFFNAPATVNAVALGPAGELALLGLDDGTAVLFDARRGGIRRVLPHDGRVRSVALDASARFALTGSEDQSARLWDVASGAELRRWTHDAEVRLVALSPDGARALSVSKYERAMLWDTATGGEFGALPVWRTRLIRGETFTAVAFSADGEQLLTGTSDRRVQLWGLAALARLEEWDLPRREEWKRSGAYVLAVGFGAPEGACLSVSADGFVHRLAVTP